MMNRFKMLLAVLWLAHLAFAADATRPGTDLYVIGPDSQPQDGVPKGNVLRPLTLDC